MLFGVRKSILACPRPSPFLYEINPVLGSIVKSPTLACFNTFSFTKNLRLLVPLYNIVISYSTK